MTTLRKIFPLLLIALAIQTVDAWGAIYYVNDDSQVDDVYTSEKGDNAYSGTSSNRPVASLNYLLSKYVMQAGDTIYVDTGQYRGAGKNAFTVFATEEQPFQIIGSPNGTSINQSPGFDLVGEYFVVKNIIFNGNINYNGFTVSSPGLKFSLIENCYFFNLASGTYVASGVFTSNKFANCVFHNCNAAPFSPRGIFDGNQLTKCVFSLNGRPLFYFDSAEVRNLIVDSCFVLDGSFGQAATRGSGVWCYNLFCNVSGFGNGATQVESFQAMADATWHHNATIASTNLGFLSSTNFHLLPGSLGIDFGFPLDAAWTNEPLPNGGRVNVGAYGGTREATASLETAWVHALGYDAGGTLVGTGTLVWASGNLGDGATVDLQYTTNGMDWLDIATNIVATNEQYAWSPSFDWPSVKWRVKSSSNSRICATNSRVFGVKRTPDIHFTYYVNDDSLNGDQWCHELGDDNAPGVSPYAPKRSLQSVIDTYVLRGGDEIRIDTGRYETNATVEITSSDAGDPENSVRIVGSPNGTYLDRLGNPSFPAMAVSASYVTLSQLHFAGGRSGVQVNNATNVVLDSVFASGYGGNGAGIHLIDSRNAKISHAAVTGTRYGVSVERGSGNVMEQCVFYGNDYHISASVNALAVSNSIFSGGIALFANVPVSGDYNVIAPDIALDAQNNYPYLSSLENSGFGWVHALKASPAFVDAPNGDFHLLSTNGYCRNDGIWVTNGVVHSPAIDFGNPELAVGREPAPNGNRLNCGIYGGSEQASKSATGAWLQLISHMDGDILNGDAAGSLFWTGGNFTDGATLSVYLSKDNGTTWEPVANGIAANEGVWSYGPESWPYGSSLRAQLKIALDGDEDHVFSWTDTPFTYRQGPFVYYVNDISTNGDVYCRAPGNDSNSGTAPESPKATLGDLLATYPPSSWQAGDEIYVDTGFYEGAIASEILLRDAHGSNGVPIRIIGSTNRIAGGSQIASALVVTNSSFLSISDLFAVNGLRGVSIYGGTDVSLSRVEARSNAVSAFSIGGNSTAVALDHCVSHGSGVGLQVQLSTNVTVQHSLFWQNTNQAVAISDRAALEIQNSILASDAEKATLVAITHNSTLNSDYNDFYAGENTWVGQWADGQKLDNLRQWQTSSGLDGSSLAFAPGLADPDKYDYHLKTTATRGRWNPATGTWTTDTENSPLLDAGDPEADASLEPGANGGRVNIGVFGGTAEASQAPSSPWVLPVTFADAGSVAANGGVQLKWIAGTNVAGTLAVDVSFDGGKNWQECASGISATNGGCLWTLDDTHPDTPAGLWRVRSEENGHLFWPSESFFSIRRRPLSLYINNYDTNETVYTTTAGKSDNWMATSNEPLNSLALAFDRFDLEAGDTIYVDSGFYQETSPVRVGLKTSGNSNQPVRVIGDTTHPYTGTVLARPNRARGNHILDLHGAEGVAISCLAVSNAYMGITMEDSSFVGISTVRVTHAVSNGIFAGVGAENVELRNCIVENNENFGLSVTGATVAVNNSLFQNNRKAAVFVGYDSSSRSTTIVDSILTASGNGGCVYRLGQLAATNVFISDYNDIKATDGACVGTLASGETYRFLYDWQQAFGKDLHSFGFDSLFYDSDAGDYHLKSEYGRFENGRFVTNDPVTSKLIDLGSSASVSDEPEPNGGRINVGLYGGTKEASKSSGEISIYLLPLTMSDGGVVRGEVTLTWAYNGIAPDNHVLVYVSTDGGDTWTKIGRETVSYENGVVWNTTATNSTGQALWKVMLEENTNICGQTESCFSVKNEPLRYYVNDASTNGDVYCSAPGTAAGSGISSNSPLNSLETLFNRYQIDPGDTILVDTGIYELQVPLRLSQSDWNATNSLVIQGSTNAVAGGSVFVNKAGSGTAIELSQTWHLELRDLTVRGGDRGIALLDGSCSNRFIHIRVLDAAQSAFDLEEMAGDNEFIQCAALNFMRTGLSMAIPRGLSTPQTNVWSGGVMISSGKTNACGVLSLSGAMTVSNSVFVLNGPDDFVFWTVPGIIASDYNCYHRKSEAACLGRYAMDVPYGRTHAKHGTLDSWREANGWDFHSFEADPLFVDETNFDLHPKSKQGHFDNETGGFVADDETSPLIDMGRGNAGDEMVPNGGKRNIGYYGGTPEASLTPTNSGRFVLMSYASGGVMTNSSTLRWESIGLAGSYDSTPAYSLDGGANWVALAGAGSGECTLVVEGLPSSRNACWRLTSSRQDQIATEESQSFFLHSMPITYYVNDVSTNGDVYCKAIGESVNTGLSDDSPLPSLNELFSKYVLCAGDTIKLDTGIYAPDAPIHWPAGMSGDANRPIVLIGSTNVQAGGSVFKSHGLRISDVEFLHLSDLRFRDQTGRGDVISLEHVANIRLGNMEVLGSQGDALQAVAASNLWVTNALFADACSNGVTFAGCFNANLDRATVWSNEMAQIAVLSQPKVGGADPRRTNSCATVSNSIAGSFGVGVPCYLLDGCSFAADYNDCYAQDGGLVALQRQSPMDFEWDSVTRWQADTGNDSHSLSRDPLFANVRAGDFHLRSSGGRMANGTWVYTDTADSPVLDAGDPDADATGEPAPNGGRLNLGRYAGTFQASKTPDSDSLVLVQPNDGGRIGGSFEVKWLARGSHVGNGRVIVWFSSDGGNHWERLGDAPATAGSFEWDTTPYQTSAGKIKIESDSSTGVSDASEQVFSVRNKPVEYYINDDSRTGDVYCNAEGSPNNTGLSTNSPLSDLNDLLAKYDLEAGDTVYIDTGTYELASPTMPWRITQADSAFGNYETDGPVRFLGSTNYAEGGTLLKARGGSRALTIENAQGVEISDVAFTNAQAGSAVFVTNGYDIDLSWLRVSAASEAYTFAGGSNVFLSHSSAIQVGSGISVSADEMSVSNCVIWKPAGGPALKLEGQRKTVVRDSVFAIASDGYAFDIGDQASLDSDYNAFKLDMDARLFMQNCSTTKQTIVYETVASWASASGNDKHSFSLADLGMLEPESGDFHLKSTAGRCGDDRRRWYRDATSSALIDAGDPSGEAEPDGSRRNIGLYGGSPFASKSPAESSLVLLSLNQGGVADGRISFVWQAHGAALQDTVKVQVSTNNGADWFKIADHIPAADGEVSWNSGSIGAAACLWEVSAESDPALTKQSEQTFTLHNRGIAYYVNDGSTNGDVYCTAVGNDVNDGLSSATPKSSLQAIIDAYNLEAGDVVYVDTGDYLLSTAVVLGELDGGLPSLEPAEQVTICGSSNRLDGGTLFLRADGMDAAIRITNAIGVRLCNLAAENAAFGLSLSDSYFVSGENLEISSCGDGVKIDSCDAVEFNHSAFYNNSRAGIWISSQQSFNLKSDTENGPKLWVDCGVLWSNRYGLYVERGIAFVSNSIMGIVLPGSAGYCARADMTPVKFTGDYNNLYVAGEGASAAVLQYGSDTSSTVRTTRYETVSRIVAMRGHELHSLAHDPLLADPAKGDFHLCSPGGRFSDGEWVYGDKVYSPLIDSGDPLRSDWADESAPNGRRMNIGMFAGTREASRSLQDGSLVILTLNDGGTAGGEVELNWTARGGVTNSMLCLRYSPDAGLSWTNIACGVEAAAGSYLWDSTEYGSSALGMWEIYSEDNPAICARSLDTFTLRNDGGIFYYVNDGTVSEGGYCSMPGSPSNDGLSPDAPLDSVQAVLDLYDLDPEDVVYVDGGTYDVGAPALVIGPGDSGWWDESAGIGRYVRIQGQTNPVYPTVFQAPSATVPLMIDMSYSEYVCLSDIIVRNGMTGIDFGHTISNRLENMRLENMGGHGLALEYAADAAFKSVLVWNAASNALIAGNSSFDLLNCVLWGSSNAISVGTGVSRVGVTNSVLQASGSDSRIYQISYMCDFADIYEGDYNDYHCENDAILCEQGQQVGGSILYAALNEWSAASGMDAHSMTLEPSFADPGNGDFHPRSEQGRYAVTNIDGKAVGIWVDDYEGIRSPLIDAGNLAVVCENEPVPNGGIVNIGMYGNTPFASKTPTNKPWLQVISYNAGEIMSGTVVLYWIYGGIDENEPVEIFYSEEDGVWKRLARTTAGAREYVWDTSALRLVPKLSWKVQLVSDDNIRDESDVPSAIKNGTFTYYVNDGATNGDVFCSIEGAPYPYANGTNSSSPLSSMEELLSHYPVGAGDTVRIDTGIYPIGFMLTSENAGNARYPLLVVGSTNGSVFSIQPDESGVMFQNTHHIRLENIQVHGGKNAFSLENASDIELDGIAALGASSNGILVANGADVAITHALSCGNGAYGYYTAGNISGSRSLEFVTFSGNGRGAVFNGAQGLTVSNSILSTSNAVAVTLSGQTAIYAGDYNAFCDYGTNHCIATNDYLRTAYRTLSAWQQDGGEKHSTVLGDVGFVDIATGDYHLRSQTGSWHGGHWTADGQTSWGIDFGNPADDAYQNEPNPNGTRVNVGAYGGTEWASKSSASEPELKILTLADGGIATNGIPLHWQSRGIPGGSLVEISYWNGTELVLLAKTNVNASPFVWESQAEPTPESYWEIKLADNPSVFTRSETFSHRPTPITYYVNDDSTEGDVYCDNAVGNATNLGYRANSPLPSVEAVLNRFQLVGGDRILVDTGTYDLYRPMQFNTGCSGTDKTENGLVSICGSTNAGSGGSLLRPAGRRVMTGMEIAAGTKNLLIRDLRLDGFQNGISIAQSAGDLGFANLDIANSSGSGIVVNQAQNLAFEHLLIRHSRTNGIALNQANRISLDGSVLWDNKVAVSLNESSIVASNNVFEAGGANALSYYLSTTGSTIVADYNAHYIHDGGNVASMAGVQSESLPQWVAKTQQDAHSLGGDPLFVDPENGDFHPKSVTERYVSASDRWVRDAVHSPLIDAGYPTNNNFANEGLPNGSRINIGLYGNTWQASKSQTNAWVQPITGMAGGIMDGTIVLYWNYGGDLTGRETATLQYSGDNGSTWTLIGTTAVSNRSLVWNSAKRIGGNYQWESTPGATWNIVAGSASNQTALFGLRNEPFKYYLNDAVTNGDAWCTAPGNDDNLGYWAKAPKLTLSNLLSSIDAEAGDTIYIDAGTYVLHQNETWPASDAGVPGNPLNVVGCSNASRFVYQPPTNSGAMFTNEASYVRMSGISFQSANPTYPLTLLFPGTELEISDLDLATVPLRISGNDSRFSGILVSNANVILSGTNNSVAQLELLGGQVQMDGANQILQQSVVYNNALNATGVLVRANGAAVSNCTVVTPRGSAVAMYNNAGQLALRNNILVAGGSDAAAAIYWGGGSIVSDYNDLVARDKAWIGIRDGKKWERLPYWQTASGQDANSVSIEPSFVSERDLDFHLNSTVGYWNRRIPDFDIGLEDSPLIDIGDPKSEYGVEVKPNGDRINLGAYGGTREASKSSTSLYVTALSPNDGGVFKGNSVVLRWHVPENYTGTVTLQYKSGSKWVDIATNIPAADGTYTWNTKTLNLFSTKWRVALEDETDIMDDSDAAFDVRNKTQIFYVNTADDSQFDDGYCTAPGKDSNNGRSAAKPKASLQAILDAYDLEPGDKVLVDAGTYTWTNAPLSVIWSRSGTASNPVIIQGYTNDCATWLLQTSTTTNILDVKASGIQLKNLSLGYADGRMGAQGIFLDRNSNVTVQAIWTSNMLVGIEAKETDVIEIKNSAFYATDIGVALDNASSACIENNTFVNLQSGEGSVAIDLDGTVRKGLTIQNNIFHLGGSNVCVYGVHGEPSQLHGDTGAFVDYNLYSFPTTSETETTVAFCEGVTTDFAPANVGKLLHWQLAQSNDYRSAVEDAALAGTGQDALDFHPRSEYGRWTTEGWTPDDVTSFAVDHGNPDSDYANEPDENGSRINIGMYGNTSEASQGPDEAFYAPRTLTDLDGSTNILVDLGGTYVLVWDAHAVPEGTVDLEFSNDGGASWANLATGIAAYNEYFVLPMSVDLQTDMGKWRIRNGETILCESTGKIMFQHEMPHLGMPIMNNGRLRFTWENGLGGREYWIVYSDDHGKTWQHWPENENGPASINRNHFILTKTRASYTFEDRTSYQSPHRMYCILELPIGADVDEYIRLLLNNE